MKNVLWIPTFSMRSHETGQYAILKDGNFQLALNRVLGSDFERVSLVVPKNASDFDEAKALVDELATHRAKTRGDVSTIYLLPMSYGANAVDTRKTFWERNNSLLSTIIKNFDLTVTDITGYCWFGITPFVNNFNITKISELDRPYIDEFFDVDVTSAKRALFTTVLNPAQKEELVKAGVPRSSVLVYQKVCHENYYFKNAMIFKSSIGPDEIFWPFRISDKAYKFEEFLEAFEKQNLHREYQIVITDPNDTYALDKPYIRKIKPTKAEYYMILSERPTVVMLDDIDLVLHPGTIEFFLFGCPTIVFRNSIIKTSNAIDSLDDLFDAFKRIGVIEEQNTDLRPFLYRFFDTSTVYCKKNIEELLALRVYC